MIEHPLKAKLTSVLRKELTGFVILRLEDKLQSGIPDMVITGNNRTSWWEIKAGAFHSKGIQELTLIRLARAGYARYIIFREDRILIVHPNNIKTLIPEFVFPAKDYLAIAKHIHEIHLQRP